MNTTLNYVKHHCGTIDMSKLPPLLPHGQRAKGLRRRKRREGHRTTEPPSASEMTAESHNVRFEGELEPKGGPAREAAAEEQNIMARSSSWQARGGAATSAVQPGFLPPIIHTVPASKKQDKRRKEHKPRVSMAAKAKERYDASVNTRSIRTLIIKPGAEVDRDEYEAMLLADQTGFPIRKIKELRRVYRTAVKRDPGLMQDTFKKVMASFGIKNASMVGRVFDVLDTQKGRHLTFGQFVNAIHLFMKGTREEQARVLFKMIDASDDRSISKLEMLHFFAGGLTMRDEKKLVGSIVSEMMNMIDEDGSGEVTFDEFVNKVANDEEVWVCFQSISPLTQLIKGMNFDVDGD